MTFYDRDDELDALDTAFASSMHAFYVVYGCRRVGKTRVIQGVLSGPTAHLLPRSAGKNTASARSSSGRLRPTSTIGSLGSTAGTTRSTISVKNSRIGFLLRTELQNPARHMSILEEWIR